MDGRRWTNPTQPQTLQIAVFLLYINAAFAVLFLQFLNPLGLILVVGGVAAGFGIANEKRWGYGLGLVMALFPFVFRLAVGGSLLGPSLINLMFEIALVALLLHPQSRDYQRIWFS
jgi:arginine exporter protein ArgO